MTDLTREDTPENHNAARSLGADRKPGSTHSGDQGSVDRAASAQRPAAIPLLRPVPPTFRQRIRAALPDGVAPKFDELCAWEDDVLEAFNLASAAADRMAKFLEGIERTLPVVADHIEENYPGRAIQLRVLADQSRKEARGADA